MTKRKGTEGHATQLPTEKVLVILSFSFGFCVACPSFLFCWRLCCLSFCPFSLKGTDGQATQWPKTKGQKDKQHNGKKKTTAGQTTQLPTEKDSRTNNTMAKRKSQKDKQHNDQKKRTEGQATQWPKLSFCPFLLVIVLLVLL
jgi:hypothetical protein